jgi:hypothetical protein
MLSAPVRGRAREILERYALDHPGEILGGRKPGTWAAGSLHAAFMTLGGPRMGAGQLAALFQVSAGTVFKRSIRLRKHIRRSDRPVEKERLRHDSRAEEQSVRDARLWARRTRKAIDEGKPSGALARPSHSQQEESLGPPRTLRKYPSQQPGPRKLRLI